MVARLREAELFHCYFSAMSTNSHDDVAIHVLLAAQHTYEIITFDNYSILKGDRDILLLDRITCMRPG